MIERRPGKGFFVVVLLVLAVLSTVSYAIAPELRFFSTRLNWFDGNDSDSPRNHNRTLLVVWEGGTPQSPGLQFDVYFNGTVGNTFNFTIANNCGFGASTANCTCWSTNFTTHTGPRANCTIQGNVSVPFGMTWNGTTIATNIPELTLFIVSANATNGTQNTFTAANLSWLRIPESKVFHTLVEFGRGRGNYFYDSAGRESSAGVGTGEPYLPNGTRIELNFLHKAFNVRNYFRLPIEKAENATWRCLYANSSMVRSHFLTDVLRTAGSFNATFRIPEIEGSFERQGYMGQQFEPGEAIVGQSFVVNCTAFSYTLGNASGNISVDVDDFNLSFRDARSVNFTASTGTSSIGIGTQEVIINYTIHNKEIFPVTEVQVEIGAPLHSQFISVRGELFGVGLKKYLFVTSQIPARGNESIELIARFNTTNADAGLTALNLSGPSRISVVNSWDKNAYNPSKTVYAFQDTHTVTVDMATTVRSETLIDVVQLARNLTNITLALNRSMFELVLNLTNTTLRLNASLHELVLNLTNTTLSMNASMFVLVLNLTNTTLMMNRSVYELVLNLTNTTLSLNSSLFVLVLNLTNTTLMMNRSMFELVLNLTNTTIAANVTIFNMLVNLTNITLDTNATITRLFPNISRINIRLDRIEEFQNELIFLVTDSFGAQQDAIKQFGNGQVAEAVDSMRQANQDLLTLAQRIEEERALAIAQSSSPLARGPSTGISAIIPSRVESGVGWASTLGLGLVFTILLMVAHHMYVTRRKF